MENKGRSSVKKARVESPSGYQVKQELAGEEDGEETSRRSALVPVDGAAARAEVLAPVAVDDAAASAEVVVRIDKGMLHCPLCTLALKPPIFQCGVGHLACGSCHGQIPTNQCHSCDGGGGAYARCPAMDSFISKAMVPCPYQGYGCRASVAYYQTDDHKDACPHAPCACAEPSCAFVGTPTTLLAHLTATPHSWPLDRVRYGEALRLRVPEAEHHHLLVADEVDSGMRVFVLAVGDRSARAVPVTVTCVRASGAAAVGPSYTCKMWATGCRSPAAGKVESVLVDMEVPSTAAAGGTAAADEDATFLGVPRKMLHGASSQMLLSVRIDRITG